MFLVMKSKKLPHPLVKPMAVFSDKVMESFLGVLQPPETDFADAVSSEPNAMIE